MNYTSKITLRLELLCSMPDNQNIYISGNTPQIGNWNPKGVALKQINKQKYEIVFSVPQKSVLEFKITRGTWKTQAIFDFENVPPDNMVIEIGEKAHHKIQLKILGFLDMLSVISDPVMGTLELLDDIEFDKLRYPRTIRIWKPHKYNHSNEPISVIYMHDAQNLFEPATSFAGIDWKVDETISLLLQKKIIKNCMVVGIDNSPDRMEELNFFTETGKAYAEYLLNVLKPLIDKKYKLSGLAEHNFVMGSSMGGLMSFQLYMAFPEVFGGAACLSSAFQKTNGLIFDQVNSAPTLPLNGKIYLDTGEYEPPIASGYFKMKKILIKKGFEEEKNLMGFYDKKATHTESAWAKRLHIPLKFLLSA